MTLRRPRKLLLKRKEINKIIGQITQKGYTLVPTQIHLSKGLAKMEIAVAKGKKLYDKREALRKKDDQRRAERAMKDYDNNDQSCQHCRQSGLVRFVVLTTYQNYKRKPFTVV